MIRIRTRSERNQGKEEGEENQLIFGKHVQISAASEESLSSDLGKFVEHCTPASGESSTTAKKDKDKDNKTSNQKQRHRPASGESSTTAEEGESGNEEADAKDEVAVKDVVRCK